MSSNSFLVKSQSFRDLFSYWNSGKDLDHQNFVIKQEEWGSKTVSPVLSFAYIWGCRGRSWFELKSLVWEHQKPKIFVPGSGRVYVLFCLIYNCLKYRKSIFGTQGRHQIYRFPSDLTLFQFPVVKQAVLWKVTTPPKIHHLVKNECSCFRGKDLYISGALAGNSLLHPA